MLGQFASAWLSRRFRNRTLLLVGMSTSVVCNLVMGALVSLGHAAYVPFLLTMALHGFAQATGWPGNVGLMANWTRRVERGRIMAIWGTCYLVGSVAAKMFASFVFGFMGLVSSFWASSLVLALVTVLFFFWGREKPEDVGCAAVEPELEVTALSTGNAAPMQSSERQRWTLIISMGVIYFAFKLLRYALDSWSVLIMSEHFDMSTSNAGYVSVTFDLAGFLGVIAAGWASDRLFRGSRLPVVGLMTAATLAATIGLWGVGLSSVAAFAVLLGLVGFMAMGPDSLLSGAAAMDTGSRREATMAAGIINGLGSIGPIVQEPAIGWLKTDYGLDAVFLLLVILMALATGATTLFWMAARRVGLRL
jgi:sugar phosphate permease